ncbi:transposase-like protein [Paenibacillus castaneae]|uniref:IS1595 family transposase n=1 Tax=Paenibacillus castaneae TaxID=474957 RepID=UPI000C9A9856|nr:IS1595 family transposase [Paenibacillus castaneae]NIK80482.1 transposase-like protein [Paenibacillus castaneae]
MAKEWLDLYAQYTDLSEEDKRQLFEAIKNDVNAGPKKVIGIFEGIRESRFRNGLACVHCGSLRVKRNGTYRERQRYLCKDCGKSFNDISGTPLSGTHNPEKWMRYFLMMVENKGKLLPKIAVELDIHVSTAFYWRHKILNALRSLGHTTLQGIVESDETYILESDKAKKGGIEHRNPRKRGGKAQKRGISDEQVSVVVALDRNGSIFSKIAGRGRITASQIDDVMGTLLHGDAVLCTDSATNYKAFAKEHKINHEVINIRKDGYVKKGIYHIQHVNRYHGELKYWLKRFDGVATRYLDNYLFWFRFLELNKNQDDRLVSNAILLASCQKPNFTTVRSFKTA